MQECTNNSQHNYSCIPVFSDSFYCFNCGACGASVRARRRSITNEMAMRADGSQTQANSVRRIGIARAEKNREARIGETQIGRQGIA